MIGSDEMLIELREVIRNGWRVQLYAAKDGEPDDILPKTIL